MAARAGRRCWGLLLAVAACGLPARAADVLGVWGVTEGRVPLSAPGSPWPSAFRFRTEARFQSGAPGLTALLARAGPVWDVASFLQLAFHLTAAASQTESGVLLDERRVELEPTLRWGFGPVRLSDRNRGEYRWRRIRPGWRYRNQLRLEWAPPGAVWTPFLSEEVFFQVSGAGLSENRAQLGVARALGDSVELSAAYLLRALRARPGQPWEVQHILVLGLKLAPQRVPAPE